MSSGLVSYIAWWGAYAVGALAIAFAVILRLKEPSDRPEEPTGAILAPVIVVAGLLLLGLVLIGRYAQPVDMSWSFGVAWLVGGAMATCVLLFSRWRIQSRFRTSSDGYFGTGLALLVMAFLRNYFRDTPEMYLILAALGAWLVAGMLYFGRPGVGWHGIRSYALTSMVITTAVSMGLHRYPKSAMGSLFAVDACALALLIALIGSILATLGKAGAWKSFGAGILIVLGIGLFGRLLGIVILDEATAGFCVVAGSLTVLVVYLLSSVSGGIKGNSEGLLGSNEAGVLAVLLATACAALSLRWLGGYGATLASIGGLAVLPLVYGMIDANKAGNPEEELVGGGVGLVSALAAVGLVRVFAENTGGTGVPVHIFESYVITGLIAGGLLPLVLAAFSGAWSVRNVGPIEGLVRGFGVIAIAVGIVLAAAYFWRNESMMGLMLGIAIGLFLLITAAPFCGRPTGAPDIVLGIQMFAVAVVPSFLVATTDLTRDNKLFVMLYVFAAAAVFTIATSIVRLRRLGS